MYVYSCNALSARFFDVDRALNSHFMIMIMIMIMRHQPGLQPQSEPTVCTVLSRVCATTVDKWRISVSFERHCVRMF